MKIAVIGAGRIGANVARGLARAGHSLSLCFARDTAALTALAGELGAAATSPADAVAGADVVVVSVPWRARGGRGGAAGVAAAGLGRT